MFLIPLDDQRRWFRYHHLFADLLHVRLLTSQPGLVKTLHHRASVWHEANGRFNDAMNHSLEACDYERSADLLDQVSIQMISQGELSTLNPAPDGTRHDQ